MIEQQNQILPNSEAVEEIDLMAIAKSLWNSRKTIIISLGVGALIGFFMAISTPNEYTVSTVMVPQMASSSKSQLGGLAALAGIDMGMSQSSELSPVIYPKIVNSIPFKLELMNTPIHFSDFDKPISLFEYSTKQSKPSVKGVIMKYTLGLPSIILKAIRKKPQELVLPNEMQNKPIQLSDDQYKIKKDLDEMISLKVEKKEGYLTLVVRMPEALAAAELAQKAMELLQRDITNFKIEKSQADLNFIQGRYDVAKAEAERYQVSVAVNTDRFKNLTSNLPQIGTTRIQTKFAIANNVFLDLAKQLEQAKIQVKKDTPVFTIVEPVAVPSRRSKPNRLMILVIWIFLGGIAGVGIVYGKQFMVGIKQKWNETDLVT